VEVFELGKFFKILVLCLILLFVPSAVYADNSAKTSENSGSHQIKSDYNYRELDDDEDESDDEGDCEEDEDEDENKNKGRGKSKNQGKGWRNGQNKKNNNGVNSPSVVKVTGIALNKTTATISIGAKVQLSATLQPSNATDRAILWFSSNPDVATVGTNGIVTGKNTGTAVIYVIAWDGFHTTSCQVTVNSTVDVHVTGITLDHNNLDLTISATHSLTAIVLPDNASNKVVEWRSSNHHVTVDNSGNIKAVMAGSSVITAKTVDGGKTATCTINVTQSSNQIPVASVVIVKNTVYSVIKVGAVKTLEAVVKPDNATNKYVYWSSSNSGIAAVDQLGRVSGIIEGTALITATSADGIKSDSFTVKVIPTDKWVSVTGIHLNLINTTIPVGFTEDLRYSLEPVTASDPAVMWSSSNSNVAEVNNFGRINAKHSGTAVITCTSVDGSKTATCFVTVVPSPEKPANGILFNKIASTIAVGETDYPQISVYPVGSATPTITWTTSNSAVAIVNSSGEVSGVSSGSVVITAKTADDKTASYIVIVIPHS
jgi:uncharacterized protein YjdB